MGKISLLSLVFLLFAQPVFADVNQFVFTTAAQTILPRTLSEPITVQAQNGSTEESIPETFDLVFTSTSPTGQFLGSTGKAISKTMAKGTANRTFYYSDPIVGTYTLTVTATGRTSRQSFSATQQIMVVTSLPPKVVISPPAKTSTKITVAVSTKSKVPKISTGISLPEATTTLSQSTSTSNLATVYEANVQASAFDSLFDWPGKFWNWLTEHHFWLWK